MDLKELKEFIAVARGEKPADLVLKNANLVNVFSTEVEQCSIAIWQGRIVGLGDYQAAEEIDLKGKYVCPGFFDGHVHIESSMVPPPEYARAVVPLGTTSVVIDPHEIANVLGLDGIKFMLESSQYLPLGVYVMLSSCVPATNMETSGAALSSKDLASLIRRERVLGIAEMMNYPGVLFDADDVLGKVKLGLEAGKRVDGHAPLLSGKDLCAYIGVGISSDHECTRREEAREKLRLGMHIMIREGSTARNLEELLPLVTPANSRYCFFITDDRHPEDLLKEGHINFVVKKAINLGLDPIVAIQMATVNAAEYFGLKNLGAVAPGYQADLVVFDNFKDFNLEKVFKAGQLVAAKGFLVDEPKYKDKVEVENTFHVAPINSENFQIEAQGKRIKVIGIVPGQIVTKKLAEVARIEDEVVVSEPAHDILKIAVVERHKATGNIGLGFVKGFGLKEGAIGSSVAHDSHNIVLVGISDEDMAKAVQTIINMGGGQVVVKDGQVIESLPLPIAGLMSDRPLEEVSQKVKSLHQAAQGLGCVLPNAFMALSFLALPVIPELKLTDKGLVDVVKFEFTSLFEKE